MMDTAVLFAVAFLLRTKNLSHARAVVNEKTPRRFDGEFCFAAEKLFFALLTNLIAHSAGSFARALA